MKTELVNVKNQINTLLAYFASIKDFLKHFATMATNLVHASINKVLIYLLIFIGLFYFIIINIQIH